LFKEPCVWLKNSACPRFAARVGFKEPFTKNARRKKSFCTNFDIFMRSKFSRVFSKYTDNTQYYSSPNIDTFDFSEARKEQHPFHIVTNSIIPFVVALCACALVTTIALVFNDRLHFKAIYAIFSFFFLLICEWCVMVSKEGLTGHHTKAVLKGLKLGFVLFIVSEVMFFFSFF